MKKSEKKNELIFLWTSYYQLGHWSIWNFIRRVWNLKRSSKFFFFFLWYPSSLFPIIFIVCLPCILDYFLSQTCVIVSKLLNYKKLFFMRIKRSSVVHCQPQLYVRTIICRLGYWMIFKLVSFRLLNINSFITLTIPYKTYFSAVCYKISNSVESLWNSPLTFVKAIRIERFLAKFSNKIFFIIKKRCLIDTEWDE